MSVAN